MRINGNGAPVTLQDRRHGALPRSPGRLIARRAAGLVVVTAIAFSMAVCSVLSPDSQKTPQNGQPDGIVTPDGTNQRRNVAEVTFSYEPGDSCGILAAEPEMFLLMDLMIASAQRFSDYYDRFDELAGLGKYFTAEDHFGVYDGPCALHLYKTKTSASLHCYEGGVSTIGFTFSQEDSITRLMAWVPEYEAHAHVTIEKGQMTWLYFKFANQNRVSFTVNEIGEPQVVFHFPVDEDYYSISGKHSQCSLHMSGNLNDALFHAVDLEPAAKEETLRNLCEDVPRSDFCRIVLTGVDDGVDLTDSPELLLLATDYLRSSFEYPPVTCSELLEEAGNNHLRYVRANWDDYTYFADEDADVDTLTQVHYEEEGKPFFTGKTPSDRAKYVGYDKPVLECGGAGTRGNAVLDVLNMYDTVYHRHSYLDVRVETVSHSYLAADGDKRALSVQMYGVELNLAETFTGVRTAPYHGQTDVPVAWDGSEAPAPLKDLSPPFGTPLTHFYLDDKYVDGVVRLLDPEGNQLPLYTELRPEFQQKANFNEVIPKLPLAPNRAYQMIFEGDGFAHTTTFTTRSVSPVFALYEKALAYLADRIPALDPATILSLTDSPDYDVEVQIENQVNVGSDYRTITNLNYGFSVTIPAAWKYTEFPSGTTPFYFSRGKDFQVVFSAFPVYPNATNEWLIEADEEHYGQRLGQDELVLGGVTATLVTYSPEPDEYWESFLAAYYVKGDFALRIRFHQNDDDALDAVAQTFSFHQ